MNFNTVLTSESHCDAWPLQKQDANTSQSDTVKKKLLLRLSVNVSTPLGIINLTRTIFISVIRKKACFSVSVRRFSMQLDLALEYKRATRERDIF